MRGLIPTLMIAIVSGCAAQPSQTRAFDVYFESNKSALSADASGIVDQAAKAVRSERPSRIVVEGSATGSTRRDAQLAAECADAVVRALVAANVDPAAIDKHMTLVDPSPAIVADRVGARKVQIELVPYGLNAGQPTRRSAQWAETAPADLSAPVVEQAER